MKRIIAAFLIAPGVVPAGMTLFSQSNMDLVGALAFAMFAYPLALVVGIPVFLFYRAWGFDKWWQAVLGAAFIGLIPGLFFINAQPLIEWFWMLMVFSGIGAISGYIFWFVALWKSNKSLNSQATPAETPQSGAR